MKKNSSSNRVFTNFMGWEFEAAYTGANPTRFDRWLSPHTFSWITLEQMKFDSSWEWMMPVWYKFRDLKPNGIEELHNGNVFRIGQDLLHGTIEEVYFHLSKIIEEYFACNNI